MIALTVCSLLATEAESPSRIEDASPPDGSSTERLWSFDDAWRARTTTRESVCLNGLWQFLPLLPGNSGITDVPPDHSGWGYFKVPGIWENSLDKDDQIYYLPPEIAKEFKPEKLNSAWYRRSVTIPADWKNRRIELYVDQIQTCAKLFVDGREAGEFYYPGGTLDLTGRLQPGKTHMLALLVSAKAESGQVFMAPGRLVSSDVNNRGLSGDVFLNAGPTGAAVGDVHVITSVRRGEITFDTGVERMTRGRFRLTADIYDGEKLVKHFESPLFRPESGKRFRRQWSESWTDPKLWDIDTPENLYTVRLKMVDESGNLLDEFHPQEFGFREFYISGRDFYLNGKKIHLRAVESDITRDLGLSTPELIRYRVDLARQFHTNFMISTDYTASAGNSQYMPAFYEELSRAGIMTALTLPHWRNFGGDLNDPEQAELYRQQAEHLIRRYQNVPGVVMYAMSHNSCGYAGDQNPMKIGNGYELEKKLKPAERKVSPIKGFLECRSEAVIAEKLARSFDSSRPIYHHAGNLGAVHSVNCYLNWVPRQERGDWLEDWEKNGRKPVFFVEYGMPHECSWSSYRGQHFIYSVNALQCMWVNEFNAAILGEQAYHMTGQKISFARIQEKLGKGNQCISFANELHGPRLNEISDVDKVRSHMNVGGIRNMRARGISGLLPWDHWSSFLWIAPLFPNELNPNRFKDLKKPGVVPDMLLGKGGKFTNPRVRFVMTDTGRSLIAEMSPELGFIAGKIGDFSECGHNFRPGETVEKSLLLLNDTRRDLKVPYRWSVPALKVGDSGTVEIEPGCRVDIPIRFRIPSETAATALQIQAEFDFPGGTRQDSFPFYVIPAVQAELKSAVGLFDPEGSATPMLKELGVNAKIVRSDADLNGIELLVIGRNGLCDFPLHLSKRLQNGLKLLVLEQPFRELDRLGLRGNEYGLREVFPVMPGLIAGNRLNDWRGKSTLLPPYLDLPEVEMSDPEWNWHGFTNFRAWRAGNRGTISSVLLEKPCIGNWLPLLQGGFDLQYAPLIEFREGNGIVILSQLDLSGRTENDPEAQELLRKVLARLDQAQAAPVRTTWYAGDERGRALLETLRISFRPLDAARLSTGDLLVVGPQAQLPDDLPKRIDAGLTVLAFGLSGDELRALGVAPKLERGKFFSSFVEKLSETPEFAGISNADLHWRSEAEFDAYPSDTPGGRALGVIRSGKGKVVTMQLAPWQFDEKEFYLRTTRRRSFHTAARLLANLGAPANSGFFKALDGNTGNAEIPLPENRWRGMADPEKKGENSNFFQPDFKPDNGWRRVKVPGRIGEQIKELAGYKGWFWYRLEFYVPRNIDTAKKYSLEFGAIDDESRVWLNGEFLGEVSAKNFPSTYWSEPRVHTARLKPGKNVLTVLVNNLNFDFGILGTPKLREKPDGFYADTPISSDDPYRYYRW